jgi:hypothetical protein
MTTKHGSFGRPGDALPSKVQELVDGLHEHLNRDWSMSGGWIVVRTWDTPEHYSIVVARVEHETELVYVDRPSTRKGPAR